MNATAIAQRLPNLLVAGVKKAGTTSLFDYLGRHPEVCPADVKAINYFTPLRLGRGVLGPLSDYATHFAHSDGERFRLEASTTYFYGGASIADRIAATLPDVRVMVSLREPVQRLWSDYSMKRREGSPDIGDLSFAEYAARARRAYENGTFEQQPGFTGFARGVYADVIGPWFDALDDRFRVLLFERWVADPLAEMTAVCRWLGIDPSPMRALDYPAVNPNRDFHNRRVAELARSGYREVRKRVPAVRRLKPGLLSVHDRVNVRSAADVMPPDVRRELTVAYAPANARLAAVLRARGYDELPSWLEGAS